MDLESVLEIFRYLASPFDGNDSSEASVTFPAGNSNSGIRRPDEILKNITDYCLQHVQFLESSKKLFKLEGDEAEDSQYSSWKLTCVILSLLVELKKAIEQEEDGQTEEEKSIDVLSIQSQIVVQKSVELVVGFGIAPYLLPGVGVPEKLRKMNPCVPIFLSDVDATSHFEHFLRLSHSLEILSTCSRHASLNALITPSYASDLLAGFLQICKSPIAQPKNEAGKGALSQEQYDQVMSVRERLKSLFASTFFEYVPKSVLINSLFLIGASEKPRWVGSACNEILRDIMLSPNGLILVSTTMTETSGRFDTWKLMRIISGLMKISLEKCSTPTCPDKLIALSEQCVAIIQQNQEHECNEDGFVSNSGGDNGGRIPETEAVPLNLPYGSNIELMRIGLFCGITLLNFDFELVKSVFWDRLFYHLLQLDACQRNQANVKCSVATKSPISSSNSKEIFITMRKAAMCATVGELLLSLLKPMNVSLPLKLLQPVWSLCFQIFVACGRYLKKPVQEPNIAAVAEQLHRKLRDTLIMLFDIYGSGFGETLELSLSNNPLGTNSTLKNTTSKPDAVDSKNVDLCDFTLMLLLNQESHKTPSLNIFDLISTFGDEHDVHIVRAHQEMLSSTSEYNLVFEQYLNTCCQCLSSEILKDDKLRTFSPLLLRQLLSWGTKRHANNKYSPSYAARQKKFKSDEMPNNLDGGSDLKVSLSGCQRFITFKLLGELANEETMLEQFGSSDNVNETLGFLELLLNKFTEEACSNSSDDDEHGFDSSQLVMYALGIIGAITETAASASSQTGSNPSVTAVLQQELADMWDNLQIFIPHLRKLSQCTHILISRQGIPEMASGLLLTIGTRGVGHKTKDKTPFTSRFQQALQNAQSPMIHIKGHGILELRRLIQQKDEETLENSMEVLKIFQHNLSNEDSYVYLMSIQGMAVLASKYPQNVVPLLINEYDFICCESDGECGDIDKGSGVGVNDSIKSAKSRQLYQSVDPQERVEIRMKVGEILVKVVQNLGELAPSYRIPLTNVFFRLIRDEEPLIRASALSNLGELCHLLKFSLGIILTEVWYCVESLLNTERNVHVRRAAVHLVVLLLKGIEKDMTSEDILGDNIISQHLRDVRRYLTHLERTEVDLVTKTHCQLALQELEFIVKKLLSPSKLAYKIQILNV